MSKRDPGWWGTFSFYEGILEGFVEDMPVLDVKRREDVLASLRRCRSLIMRIEDEVLSEEPPW